MSNVSDGIQIPVEKPAPTAPAQTEKYFTEEDLHRVRQQEKDKLYKKIVDSDSRVQAMEEQLSTLSKERESAIKEAEERTRKEAELIRQREMEELSAKELLSRTEDEFKSRINQVEQEWSQKFQEMEQQRHQQEAILNKERELQQLESYRQRRMNEEQEGIVPQLIDLVQGNSQEEIENSIAVLRERSSAIIEAVQQANPQGRPRSSQVTAPPIGPLDNQMEYQTFSPEQIRDMPMDQYAKMRDRLLQARPGNRGRF